MSAPTMSVSGVLDTVEWELQKATRAFGSFASPHEGYAVILEEIDELWDEIKGDKLDGARGRQRKEARQVAAMGCRFLVDVPTTGEGDSVDWAIERLDKGLRSHTAAARPFTSPHEAYGHLHVARRHLDHAMDLVGDLNDSQARGGARHAALRVGIVAARFLLDIPEES